MVHRDYAPPRAVLEARKRMNDAVRGWFDARDFLEVETPIAVLSPGLEPHLEAFETLERGPDGQQTSLFLHTSPEYAMKRLVGRGLGSLYQIARVFRNGERSATHAPEFTLLEWYRHPGTLDAVAEDTVALIETVARAVGGPWQPGPPLRLSVSEAFRAVGLGDPLEHLDDIDGLRRALKVPAVAGDDWETVFFRAFFERIEPSFDPAGVTVLDGYPAPMAALARLDPTDRRRALRFEVFVGGVELGNAFAELADPVEQRRRFADDLRVREELGRQTPPVDEGLLRDLPGIDPSAGIALGLDRLLMTCLRLEAVQDVLCFSPRDS
ncbi:MAG: EF-P lysine aminoacylase EpmA [Myxococcota bacterium]